MTAVVSLASAKGGCSKTTLCVSLGMELVLDGYKVTILDCDLNQHASHFVEKVRGQQGLDGLSVTREVGEKEILAAMRAAAEAGADIVLVDLPGGSSMLALKALQKSHFVVIPAQPTMLDARDAIKTNAQVDDAAELSGRHIDRAIIWTRVPTGFESRAARNVRQSIESRGVPLFRAALLNRAAYQEMFQTGQVPRQVDPDDAAAANIKAIAGELMAFLASVAERQAAGAAA